MLQHGVLHRCACVKLSTKRGYRTFSVQRPLKSTKNHRGTKSEFFVCAFEPLSSHRFCLMLPPSFRFRPVPSPTPLSLLTSHFIPPLLTLRKLSGRCPYDLGTLQFPAEIWDVHHLRHARYCDLFKSQIARFESPI